MPIPLNQHGWASPASRNDYRIFSTAAGRILIDGLLALSPAHKKANKP